MLRCVASRSGRLGVPSLDGVKALGSVRWYAAALAQPITQPDIKYNKVRKLFLLDMRKKLCAVFDQWQNVAVSIK